MEINGTQTIAAQRQRVWDALRDPSLLKACLPGCESVQATTPREFAVVVAMAIGPLRARFKGKLSITEEVAPESCVMVFQGEGGAIGFGKGTSSVHLSEAPEGTELKYRAEAQVGGKLAQVGSRLIESVARKISDDFFTAFRAELGAAGDAGSVPVAAKTPVDVSEAAVKAGEIRSASSTGTHDDSRELGHLSRTSGTIMVPGWWLAVAAAVGALATLAGTLAVHG